MVDLRGARFGPISRTALPQEFVKEPVARLERGALRAGDPLPTERELIETKGRRLVAALRRAEAPAEREAPAE